MELGQWTHLNLYMHTDTVIISQVGPKLEPSPYTNGQVFEELVPSILPLLEEHIGLGHAGGVDHSI